MQKTEWTFDKEKGIWIDQNGARYSEDKMALLSCPDSFSGHFYVPDGIKKIQSDAFSDCAKLMGVTIPDSVTIIGPDAFKGCTKLLEVAVPNSVTDIGGAAFSFCSSLKKVTIPNSISIIKHETFEGCANLGDVIIPDSVTCIEYRAFEGCLLLKKIIIPDSVISIGNSAFKRCTSLKKASIPDSIIRIDESVFKECTNLKEVIIPDSVISIGDSAFEGCYNLREITIPDSVLIIQKNAFRGCPIKKITLPPETEHDPQTFDEVTMVIKAIASISYLRDNDELKKWVIKLAEDLQKNGVEVILDEWDLELGHDKTHFVEEALSKSKRVICILTPKYKEMAVRRVGDVGIEYRNMTAEIYDNILTNKFIPVLREGSPETSFPTALNGRAFVDMRDDSKYTEKLGDILGAIFNKSKHPKPKTGINLTFDETKREWIDQNGARYSEDRKTFFGCPNSFIRGTFYILSGVEKIEDAAFRACINLESVIIPNTVKSIGNRVFFGCTNLQSVTIPDSVSSIGDGAFMDCINLTVIVIPKFVTSIRSSVFEGCTKLLKAIIPNSVSTIGESAFSRCSSLKELTIPNSVSSIGENAFRECTNLWDITIPDSVSNIGNGAFEKCTNLGSIIIPDSVISIGDSVFRECSRLQETIIPGSVTSIGNSAFEGCTKLHKVIIPNSVTSIGDSVFRECTHLQETTIPGSVTSIGNSAFEGCTKLHKVIIPNSVTSIGDSVFRECSRLQETIIPNSIIAIGNSSFEGCYNLRKIIIPDSVQIIQKKAFWGCPIKEVLLPFETKYDPLAFDEVTKVIKAKVTISYSWDNEEHKEWVRILATDLKKNGIDVILDQWSLRLGQNMNDFIEKAISESEKVICIFTPNYKKKAENLKGGVGHEYSIIRAEMSDNLNGNKVIPVLREGSTEDSCPIMFKNRLYLDFRQEDSYENSLEQLLRAIF